MRGLRHAIVLAERNDEVRLRLGQHLPVVGEDRRFADLGSAPGRDGRVGVVEADELHVRHRGENAQVGGVPQGVPVTDLDGRDAHHQVNPYRFRISSRYCSSGIARPPAT